MHIFFYVYIYEKKPVCVCAYVLHSDTIVLVVGLDLK